MLLWVKESKRLVWIKVHHIVFFSHSETFASSYYSTHTVSLSSSPVGANRQVHTIHSQLQSVATELQAALPPPMIGPLFSDIQREFQKKGTKETVSFHFICGVPQGTVLDPLLFLIACCLYLKKHCFYFHVYADDTHLSITIEPGETVKNSL